MASGAMLGMLCGVPALAQNSTTPPDNTRTNQRDRSKAEATADQATNKTPDREIMQEIRQSITADKSLSTFAHNIKVIARHGQVTLKGPVHTEEERTAIETKATEVAGAGNVTNQISVKGDQPSK
jgi:hyperosmotically inducible periplasmic protein